MAEFHIEADKPVNNVVIHADNLSEVWNILRQLPNPPVVLEIYKKVTQLHLVYKKGTL